MVVIVLIVLILIVVNVNKVYSNESGGSDCGHHNNRHNDYQHIERIEETSVLPNNTQSNVTSDNKLALYYTTWCGYSRQFLPEWEKILNSDLKNVINCVSYDCDKNNECSVDGVNGYPSIILHKDGQKIKYNGSRNAESIIVFVKQNM
jgi:thioredoxin-like negative regulator of GroEL